LLLVKKIEYSYKNKNFFLEKNKKKKRKKINIFNIYNVKINISNLLLLEYAIIFQRAKRIKDEKDNH